MLAPTSAARAEPTPADIEKQIETTGDQLEDVIESYNKVNDDLKATQAAIDDLATRIEPLQADMNTAYANVDQIAVTAYKNSSDLATWGILLNAGTSNTLVDRLTSLEQISRSKQRDLAGYKGLKERYGAEKQRLDELLVQQNGQRTEIEARKAKIEGDLKKLEDLKAKAGRPKTTTASTGSTTPPPNVAGSAGKAVSFAYAQLGKPYVYGAAGPNSYDCSGLTQRAWAAAGVGLPHNARSQYDKVAHITRGALAPGDLVFYRSFGHVGIYVGNNTIIHAPSSGDVVRTAALDRSPPTAYGRPRG